MYKRMSGVKFWLLSIITFGIYALVMWISMTKQHNRMAESIGEKKIMGFFPALLLGCITFGIVPFIWYFKFFGLMSRLNKAKKAGIVPSNFFVMMIMSWIPLYNFFWLAKAHNKLVAAYEEKAAA